MTVPEHFQHRREQCPLRTTPIDPAEQPPEQAGRTAMAKKVLVVDDDQNTVKFLTVALQENGYEAAGAYDGEEGLKKLQEAKPDLVILDVMMPKRTGFTLFKRLRKDEAYKNIHVIMVTGIASVLSEL